MEKRVRGIKTLTSAQKEAYADSYKGKIHEIEDHIDYLYSKRDNNPSVIDSLVDYWRDVILRLRLEMGWKIDHIEVDNSISKFYL